LQLLLLLRLLLQEVIEASNVVISEASVCNRILIP